MKHKITILICTLILAGCSGVRNLAPTDTDMPSTYMPGLESDSASIADIEWWRFYADSTLCRLIRLALDNNRDLLKAGARVEQARQLYGVDKANMLPEISGLAGASYETNNYGGAGTSKDPEYDL